MTLKVRQTEIIQFLKGIVQSFASLAEQKNVTLNFKTNIEKLMGYIDRDKLEKIMTNLMSNAFKFTPEEGEIEVRISPTPLSFPPLRKGGKTGGVEIKISNTGPGIQSDQLDKIFDRFYQADNSYKKDSEGTGIGLALTRELVQACRGEIRVESEPEKLTTFTVVLPIAKESFKPEEIVDSVSLEGEIDAELLDYEEIEAKEGLVNDLANLKSLSDSNARSLLLIVEDNPDVTHYISSFLEGEYRIITAANGEEGLKKTLKKFPDLIISDVMMPRMDGFELCKKLKTDQRISHIPIILLTARADMESKLEGLEFGADDYVTKPFDAKELQVRSRNLLEQRRRMREKFSKDLSVNSKELSLSSFDEKFLSNVIQILEEKISDPKFGVDEFSREVGMSRANLYRKLQALTGQSARDFIRIVRLKRAALLLQKHTGNIAEIAYDVGFTNPSYFSECFRKYFGQLPSEYSINNTQNKQ